MQQPNEIDQKAALYHAIKIAMRQGATEEEMHVRANDILQDALSETPETDGGKELRAMIDTPNGLAVPSDYVEEEKFDYVKLRDETTVVAAREALALLGTFEALVPKTIAGEEDEIKITEVYHEVSLKMFEILNKNNVGIGEYSTFFNLLKAAVTTLENIVMQQVQGHRTELLSRLFGTRNPGNNKYDSSFATYANLVDSLDKVRKDTGDDRSDYFNVQKS